jgi:hypothetical protein
MFNEVMSFLIAEQVTERRPSGWAYTHPLTRLYIERVMQLTGGRTRPAEDLAGGIPVRAEGRRRSRRKL